MASLPSARLLGLLDHLSPRLHFTPKRLREASIPVDRVGRYQALVDCIGNLQLLSATENLQKSAQPFEQWLTTRDLAFRQRHLIPEDPTLLTLDRFEESAKAREDLMRQCIQSLFPSIAAAG